MNNSAYGIKRYENFIEKILQTNEVFYFYRTDKKSIYGTESHNFYDEIETPFSVLPFWSGPVYPRNWVPDYEEHDLALPFFSVDDFLSLLNELQGKNFAVGIEWNAQGVGCEKMPADVIADILEKKKF